MPLQAPGLDRPDRLGAHSALEHVADASLMLVGMKRACASVNKKARLTRRRGNACFVCSVLLPHETPLGNNECRDMHVQSGIAANDRGALKGAGQ